MKLEKRRFSAAIALTLIFVMGTMFALSPIALAQDKIDVLAVAFVQPAPSQVNTTVYAVGWVTPPREVQRGVYWNFTFVVTKPDGTTFEEDRLYTNTDATASFTFVVDQTGEWSIRLEFPGGPAQNPAVSPEYKWTVQTDPVPPAGVQPDVPLPTGYWSWPISGQNREWYQISGGWLNAWADAAGTCWNQYSKAPNTPHILWTYSMVPGGILGGEQGHFSEISSPNVPVAVAGRLYYHYTGRSSALGEASQYPVIVCLDQETGEEIWRKALPSDPDNPGSGGTMGIDIHLSPKYYEEAPNPDDPWAAVTTSSGGTRFSIYIAGNGLWEVDPWTGECLQYVSGDMSSSAGKGRNILMYDGYICLNNYPVRGNISVWDVREDDIIWTRETPSGPTTGWGQQWLDRYYWIGNSRPYGGVPYGYSTTSIDIRTGEFVVNGAVQADGMYLTSGTQGGYWDGIHVIHTIDRHWYGINHTSGEQIWKSGVQSEYPWGQFGTYVGATAYGLYFDAQYDGYIYCLDIYTGELKWKFYCGDNYDVAPGNNIPWGQFAIADGKLYVATGEHTTPNPMPRGNTLFCVDISTGEEVWHMRGVQDRGSGGGVHGAGISSGMFWHYNTYDGQMYMFGKGPTETTVSASPGVVADGSSVIISGTVLDQSPALKDTPAISDEDMGLWMEYKITQNQVMPDATGVPVQLQAYDGNGDVIDIATVTTDIMGHYEYLWAPPDQGTYKILATFAGSESYWASSAQAALGVTEGVGPSGPIEPEPTADYTIAIVAAVVAVVVVALVAFWAIRRRK